MADLRDYLNDRGLGDGRVVPLVPPFPFGPDGSPVSAAAEEPPSGDMPDDYAARVLALECAMRLSSGQASDLVSDAADRVIASRKFHAFLTAAEPAKPKERTFTDE